MAQLGSVGHIGVRQIGVRQIGELQERAARALPAAAQQNVDGCWLRYTDSKGTWWAGAVLMHGRVPSRQLAERIAVAEDFYLIHGEPARFQVCPACPPDLDDTLMRRRYRLESVVSLLVINAAQLAGRPLAPSLRVELKEQADAEWFQLFISALAPGVDPAPERRLLQRVEGRSAYATVSVSGYPIAVGRAVADTGWVGVFSMATLPDARRRGAGGAVLAALADWAVSQGFSRLYLQVEQNNTAALRLYRRAGFEKACRYHYRIATPS
ncbi:MAG TPA: GNAT family N-acetyltransferase [Propionibacteriaceae bacterium]|jgi:N-acetylglutamate synthase